MTNGICKHCGQEINFLDNWWRTASTSEYESGEASCAARGSTPSGRTLAHEPVGAAECEACWTEAEKAVIPAEGDQFHWILAAYIERLKVCQHTAIERHGGWMVDGFPS